MSGFRHGFNALQAAGCGRCASRRPSPFGFVRRLAVDETGSALVFTIGVFLFLFVLILSVYSVGENIRRKEELQNACDAAAYSAAVVQADALSRMAVLNRAMAWSHIQTTKMQMDYITYKWLRRVRDCFRADLANIRETDLGDFGKPEMGYHHFSEDFNDFFGNWMNIRFSCHDKVHDNAKDARARYVGLGPNTEGGLNVLGNAAGGMTGGLVHLPDRHWIRINGFAATDRRLQYNEWTDDLDYYEGGSCKASSLVRGLARSESSLRDGIRHGKQVVSYCGAMLSIVYAAMRDAVPAVVQDVLYANLPRKADGSVDDEIRKDYVFSFSPGISSGIPYSEKSKGGYFDGLNNCEEDEIRFLSMANGLSPVNDDFVKLKDFFASPGVDGGMRAAGLDQWFIRCDPEECRRNKVGVYRAFVPPPAGIQRCYKNANYAEGRTADGILRGNYCLDGNSPKRPDKPSDIGFTPFVAYWYANSPPGSGWWWLTYGSPWISDLLRVPAADQSFRSRLNHYWGSVPYSIFSEFATSPDPSCINYRDRFPDQCSHVQNTTGLVAEYEWASAYWFCCWLEFKKFGGWAGYFVPFNSIHQPICIHIPIPSAVFGGRIHGAHYGDADTSEAIAKKQREMWKTSNAKDPQLRNLALRGWSRSDYRRTFIGADGESRYGCMLHGGDANGANMGAKGYVRIYGDDLELFDEQYYCGAKAMPWVLNERFFTGEGTIVVGVARKQRNVFGWIGSDEGVYKAFTPDGEDRPQPRLVALAAARAAWAPRSGGGKADGRDSENRPDRGNGWGRHYELRHDAVTSIDGHGNLSPELASGVRDAKTMTEIYRIGCVCGKSETGKRLRRQWNLCQTDWDAVLLPIRHAFADPSLVRGAPYDSARHGTNPTSWSYAEGGGEKDPQDQLVRMMLSGLTWIPLSSSSAPARGKGEKWADVFLSPNGMSDTDAYRLFKKRLVH